MWITTCHRFASRAEFLAACGTAGWTCPPGRDPEPPLGVALDILGPVVAPVQIGDGGVLIPGDVLDPRYHVNVAWHGRDPDPAFHDSLVVPARPSRAWDIAPLPASNPPVPAVIPAWKGKAALREAGLLDVVEAAVAAAGGRMQDAWVGASAWDRGSELLAAVISQLGLNPDEADRLFREAEGIQG
jgi:hypothetical protein